MIFANILLPLAVFSGQFAEPTRKWYIAISPMYSVWILATLFFLPFEKFGYWLIVSIYRKLKRKSVIIQKEYEDLYSKREFDFTHKMPYLLGLLTIVMYFVGGMPFLIIIFALYALAYFWIEKLMILRFYKKPNNLDEIAMRFSDYIILCIFVMHLFSAIIMFGTADVFPTDTEYVNGVRKGYTTNYYQAKAVSFAGKFGLITNIPYLALLALVIIFFVLTFVFRNKVLCRKFKYFPMSFSHKYKYVPGTYNRVKNNCVIGEVTYNIADLEKYRDALTTLDLSKINQDGFKAGYSQLFQTSNGPIETLSKLNMSSLPDKTYDGLAKNNYSGMLPPIADPRKMVEPLKSKDLTIKEKPKDPKVQVVDRQGKMFDRRKTFIKNWEFEDPNEEIKYPDEEEVEKLDK